MFVKPSKFGCLLAELMAMPYQGTQTNVFMF